jgi:transcriptional regulator with XRE-family HTH domain
LDSAIAFGKVLRKLRKEAGLTQEQLGFEANLQRIHISLFELGTNQPTLNSILKLGKALKIPAKDIVGLVEAELPKQKKKGSAT